MSDTAVTAKPTVFQTTDDTAQEHLKSISQNLDAAINKPVKSGIKDVQATFDQEPLDDQTKKQAENFEPAPAVENPVDKDKIHHKLFWFLRPKSGDVGASEVFKEKVKYVDLKGGQKTVK